ncbi:MAG: outer membrane protein assembly factor BamC [Cellvibrionaceae bacterium]
MSQIVFRFLVILFTLLLVVISGCSTKSPEYLKSTTIPPLTVPEQSDNERLGQLYRVPQQAGRKPDDFEVPFPPSLGVQDDANIASVQRLGEQVWVLNAQLASTTWSQLVYFWQSRNVAIVKRDLDTATIETDWFEQAVQPGFATRYRMRLERGLQANTTEIHLTNDKSLLRGVEDAPEIWAERVQDRAHANWLANELVKVLNDSNTTFGDSYLATTIDLSEKVTSDDVNQEPVLRANINRQRLDSALSKVLSQDGFSTYEKDTSKGIYYFDQYEVKSKKSGLFSFITFTSGDDESTKRSRYDLETLLANLQNTPEINALFPRRVEANAAKKLTSIPGYLLVAQQIEGGFFLYVRDGYGKKLSSDDAREILEIIRLRLI